MTAVLAIEGDFLSSGIGPTVWKERTDSKRGVHDLSTHELWYHTHLKQTNKNKCELLWKTKL